MDFKEIVNISAGIATVASAIAVGVGIPFLAKQAAAANATLDKVAQGLRQTSILSLRTHITDINQILIANDDLRKLFKLEEKEILAYMLLNDFETLWTHHQEGVLPEELWKCKINLIRQTVNYDWVKAVWRKDGQNSRIFQPGFVELVNSLIEEQSIAAAQ